MSIDGYVSHTSFTPVEEVFEYFTNLVHDVDLIVYGRKMYEIMFPYWADEANWDTELETKFAKWITGLEKVVFSRTLNSAKYNSRIVDTDPVEELRKLKQTPGGNILLSTVSMVPLLANAGLIDEYRLFVHPVLVGHGQRLVEDDSLVEKLNLKLIETRAFKSGGIALHYAKLEQ